DPTTNFFGNKLTSSSSISKEDNGIVGKYLKTSIPKKRELDHEEDSNEEQFLDSVPKKPKPTGYNFDFSKW
ncbi:620_t:CDS:1, partial [Scutellospora calospora]